MNLKPYKFKPLFKTVIWGGEKIARFKDVDTHLHQVGESWELSGLKGAESIVDGDEDDGLTLSQLIDRHGERLVGKEAYRKYGRQFPLLVKLIDARHDLSVQVHPDDLMAMRLHQCKGKTEMWYVIDHEPGAVIWSGFNRPITPVQLSQHLANGTVMSVVAQHASHKGETFYLPAGCIHSIGAGNFVAEIQQSSDITYRVFDHNRTDANGQKRELHTQWALEAIKYEITTDYENIRGINTDDESVIVSCDYFVVHRYDVTDTLRLNLPEGFLVMMCIDGRVEVTDNNHAITPIGRGETILIPACLTSITLHGRGTLLTAHT